MLKLKTLLLPCRKTYQKERMKAYFYILILCLTILGCGGDYFSEYELDESSFGMDTIVRIEKKSGINLPEGSKGLKYHYIPPIDPIVFAKIEIPAEARELMEIRVAELTYNATSFPKDFANDRCKWWPPSIENEVVARNAFNNGYYIEAYLIQEKERLILYLKYFTV